MMRDRPIRRHDEPTRVMIVGGGPDVLPLVEPMLSAGAYDVEFVEFHQEPYGCITDEAPDMLVVCMRIDDASAFQFLSLLQYDPVTRRIPVLTYTTEAEGQLLPGDDDVSPRGARSAVRGSHRLARH